MEKFDQHTKLVDGQRTAGLFEVREDTKVNPNLDQEAINRLSSLFSAHINILNRTHSQRKALVPRALPGFEVQLTACETPATTLFSIVGGLQNPLIASKRWQCAPLRQEDDFAVYPFSRQSQSPQSNVLGLQEVGMGNETVYALHLCTGRVRRCLLHGAAALAVWPARRGHAG